jgi:hypothetical protein
MSVHPHKDGRRIAKFPTGTLLPDDPLNGDFKRLLKQWKKTEGEGRKAKIDPNRKLPPYAFHNAFVTAALNAGGDLKAAQQNNSVTPSI